MIVEILDDFVTLRVKGVDYRCCVVDMSKKGAVSWKELISETFILALMVNDTKTRGKNWMF